ncbi:unnamed protein product [Closterium sp. NIES-54]
MLYAPTPVPPLRPSTSKYRGQGHTTFPLHTRGSVTTPLDGQGDGMNSLEQRAEIVASLPLAPAPSHHSRGPLLPLLALHPTCSRSPSSPSPPSPPPPSPPSVSPSPLPTLSKSCHSCCSPIDPGTNQSEQQGSAKGTTAMRVPPNPRCSQVLPASSASPEPSCTTWNPAGTTSDPAFLTFDCAYSNAAGAVGGGGAAAAADAATGAATASGIKSASLLFFTFLLAFPFPPHPHASPLPPCITQTSHFPSLQFLPTSTLSLNRLFHTPHSLTPSPPPPPPPPPPPSPSPSPSQSPSHSPSRSPSARGCSALLQCAALSPNVRSNTFRQNASPPAPPASCSSATTASRQSLRPWNRRKTGKTEQGRKGESGAGTTVFIVSVASDKWTCSYIASYVD